MVIFSPRRLAKFEFPVQRSNKTRLNSLIEDDHFAESLKSYIKNFKHLFNDPRVSCEFLSTKFSGSQKDMQMNNQKRGKPGEHH